MLYMYIYVCVRFCVMGCFFVVYRAIFCDTISRHRAAPVSAEVHAALLRGPPPQHASSPREVPVESAAQVRGATAITTTIITIHDYDHKDTFKTIIF